MNSPAHVYSLLERMTGDEKHSAAASSTLPVLWALYSRVMDISPERLSAPERDRLLLSKGHGPMAYYAVLAARGFFPEAWLESFGEFTSPLGQHPDRNLIPGVEIASGSLGHGLPIAVGVALGLDAKKQPGARVFTMLGDGELDEGSNHEAIAYAGRVGLARLRAVVIDNRSASHGWPGGIVERFAVEDWETALVHDHDEAALISALDQPTSEAPRAIVVRTTTKE